MTKNEMELIYNIEKEKEKVLKAEALKPFLKDRTLLYGYTCERKTFHTYLKDMEIHVVVYDVNYSGKPHPVGMKEIEVHSNQDYVPDKRLYPETCDYTFCKLLKRLGIELPFTTYNEDRPKANFYGFTLEDAECAVSGKAQTVMDHSVENFKKGFVSDEIKLDEF